MTKFEACGCVTTLCSVHREAFNAAISPPKYPDECAAGQNLGSPDDKTGHDEHTAQLLAAEFAFEARRILRDVVYLDYDWEVREDVGFGILIRATYMDADIYNKKQERQYTAWVSVSIKSGLSRVVSGAMKLALTSAEHRCREAFTYRGRRIFGPHFHTQDLYDLCKDREDAHD